MKETKKKHSSGRRGGDAQLGKRTRAEAARGPSEVADCGAGWAKLQLASEAAAGGPGDRPCNPRLQHREIKHQTTD